MSIGTTVLRGAAVLTCLGALAAGGDGPACAPASAGGKSLVVPDAHKSLGTLYYALPEREAQVSFSSKAPLENIEGNSSGVIGYAVAGPDSEPAKLRAGEWHLPVNTLRTGIKMRDGHLLGETWFDAAKYPDIVFQLKEVADVAPGKSEGDSKAFTVTLKGDMTIHGVTRPISIPDSTVTFRKGSAATEKAAKGDLLAIRARYDIVLGDYGISNKVVGQKVADNIKVDTNLVLSTVAPEEQGGVSAGTPADEPGR